VPICKRGQSLRLKRPGKQQPLQSQGIHSQENLAVS
jgi:hypothetical protein